MLAVLAIALVAGRAEALPSQPPDLPETHPGSPWVIFMNRGGGRYFPGPDDSSANVSSIVGQVADFDPYPYGDDSWNDVMRCLREVYAPFGITITDVDPGDAAHMECVFAASGGEAFGDFLSGYAPYDWTDCSIFPRGISFVFADAHGDSPRDICETAGQETAHVFGLDHVVECRDLMTWATGCGEKTFLDEWVNCGEEEPRECTCGGPTQNSYQMLLGILGPHVPSKPPSVGISAPEEGALVLPGFTVEVDAVDDGVVERVELEIDGTLARVDRLAPFAFEVPDDLAPGDHDLRAIAFDSEEQSDDDGRTVILAECWDAAPCGAGDACVDGFCEPESGDGIVDGDGGGIVDGDGGGGGVGGCSCEALPAAGAGWFAAIAVVGAVAGRRRRPRQRQE